MKKLQYPQNFNYLTNESEFMFILVDRKYVNEIVCHQCSWYSYTFFLLVLIWTLILIIHIQTHKYSIAIWNMRHNFGFCNNTHFWLYVKSRKPNPWQIQYKIMNVAPFGLRIQYPNLILFYIPRLILLSKLKKLTSKFEEFVTLS
jgi:hypothetical protein